MGGVGLADWSLERDEGIQREEKGRGKETFNDWVEVASERDRVASRSGSCVVPQALNRLGLPFPMRTSGLPLRVTAR